MVDEWGTWWDEEPGTIRGHLYQQNTMRDAMVAALSLNIFQRHTDRIKMANIAQVVNVLQSMILTDTIGKGHMVLTPTYHVFHMYRPFQDATYLPADVHTDSMTVEGGHMASMVDGKIPDVSVSTAKAKDGSIVVALANTSLDKADGHRQPRQRQRTQRQRFAVDDTGTHRLQRLPASRQNQGNSFQELQDEERQRYCHSAGTVDRRPADEVNASD